MRGIASGGLADVAMPSAESCVAQLRSMATLRSFPLSLTLPSRFTGIDTVIIRVRDVVAASLWYTQRIGAEIVYDDAEQRLAVLEFANGSTLTLWQVDDGAEVARSSTYPTPATSDARATLAALQAQEVAVEALRETLGVIYFRFTDPDGDPLAACEVKA